MQNILGPPNMLLTQHRLTMKLDVIDRIHCRQTTVGNPQILDGHEGYCIQHRKGWKSEKELLDFNHQIYQEQKRGRTDLPL